MRDFLQVRFQARVAVLIVLALLVSIGVVGCQSDDNVIQGIWVPRADGPSSAEFRIETELIPNAQRVTEDTMPQWQLGRYAFKEGVDRLLVISRITSYLEKLTMEQELDGVKPRRFDRVLERVWITIPLETQLGEEMILEDLQKKHFLDYDEGEPDGDMYVQPNQVYGKLTILEERADAVVFRMDMRVESKRLPSWRVNEVLEVSIKEGGVRAKRAKPDPLTEYQNARKARDEAQRAESAAAKEKAAGAAGSSEAESAVGVAGSMAPVESGAGSAEAAATQPADVGPPEAEGTDNSGVSETPSVPAATTQPAEQGADGSAGAGAAAVGGDKAVAQQRSLVGRWLVDMPDFEYRFQFYEDGKFIYADTRGGGDYAPGMAYGTYRVAKDDYGPVLLVHITKWVFDNQDHMKYLGSPSKGYTIEWSDKELILTGVFLRPEGKKRTLQFHPANFPDMREVLPPSGRSGKYKF